MGEFLLYKNIQKKQTKKIEIPYIIKDFKTIGERKTYSIKKNATHMETGYDNNELLNNLLYIKQEDINLYEDLKFNYESIKDIDFAEIKSVGEFDNDIVLDFDNEALESEKKTIYNPYKLYEDKNYYDIPVLQQEHIYNEDITQIITTSGRAGEDEVVFQKGCIELFNKNQKIQETKNKKAFSFFVYDEYFENIYDEAKSITKYIDKTYNEVGNDEFISFLYANKFDIIIQPNFSLLLTEPLVYRLLSTYKANWCANYFGNLGFKIIPTISIFLDKRTNDLIIDTFKVKSRYAFTCGKETALLNVDEQTIDMCRNSLQLYKDTMQLETLFVYGKSKKFISIIEQCNIKDLQVVFLNSEIDIKRNLLRDGKTTKGK